MPLILYLKKSLPYLRSCRFSLRLSFRILKILCFTFWFMIHFELIYVKVGRSVSRVIYFCMWMSCYFSTEKTLCSDTILASLSKISWLYLSLFVGSLVCSLDLLVCSCNSTTPFWLLYLFFFCKIQHSPMPAKWENSAMATGLEKVSFIPIPKKGNAKGAQTTAQWHSSHMLAQ